MHPETIGNHVLDLFAPKIFAATHLLWFPCGFGQIEGDSGISVQGVGLGTQSDHSAWDWGTETPAAVVVLVLKVWAHVERLWSQGLVRLTGPPPGRG